MDDLTNTQKSYFFGFLRSLKPAQEILENFVKSHPELMKPAKTDDAAQADGENTAADDASASKIPDLDNFDTAQLTSALLQMGFTPPQLMDWLRDDLKISADYSDTVARLIAGVRYELQLRKLGINNNAYVLAENVDVKFCSLISDGEFQGAKVSRSISSVRCRTSIRNPHFLFSPPPLARRSRSPCRVCGKYSTPALSKGESFCLGTNKISRSCCRSPAFPAGKPVS